MRLSKIVLILFSLLLFACTRVGENTYGLWFDPRGKEFEEEQARKKAEQKAQREYEVQQKELQAQREKEQHEYRLRAEETARKEREFQLETQRIEREKREEEARLAAEKRRLQEDEENYQRLQRLAEREQCETYIKKHCKLVQSKSCSPVQKCKFVNGSRVCWGEEQCATHQSVKCTNTPPENCEIN